MTPKRILGCRLLGLGLAFAACGDATQEPAATSRVLDAASVDSLLAAASGVYAQGEYSAALELFENIRDRAAAAGDPRAQAIALTSMGLAWYNLGDYNLSRAYLEEGLIIERAHELEDLYVRSHNALGLVAWQVGRFDDAEQSFALTRASAEAVNDELGAGVAAGNLGLVQTEAGEFARARASLRVQLEAGKAAIDDADPARRRRARIAFGNGYLNLGMLEVRVGNPAGAISLLDSALTVHVATPAPREEMGALGHLGTAYTQLGELGLAAELLQRALSIAQQQGNRQEEASIYEAIAEIYLGSGDYRRAFALYDKASQINDELGFSLETGVSQRMEAGVRASLGDLNGAKELAEAALVAHQGLGVPVEEMRDRLILAEIDGLLGDFEAAHNQLGLAGALANGLSGGLWRLEVAISEARIADQSESPGAVLDAIDRVEADIGRGGYTAEWQARLLTSKAYAALGQHDPALRDARRAWSAVEHVRTSLRSPLQMTAFGADKHEVYSHLIDLLLEVGRVEEALFVSDAARVKALWAAPEEGRRVEAEVLAGGPGPMGRGAILGQIEQLLESLDYYEGLAEDREIERLHERVASARAEYDRLLSSTHAAADLGAASAMVEEVQNILTPGQLLVEYFIPHEGRAAVFVVGADRLVSLPVPLDAENLYSRIRLVRDLIDKAGGRHERVESVLAGLYDVLIRPLRDAGLLEGVDELVVVPHGILTYVPFAALRDAQSDRYLVQDLVIRTLPTAGSLSQLARRGFDTTVHGTAGFAPLPAELASSSAELEALSGPTPVERYEGAAATEARLVDALGSREFVHVATHGVLNPRNPLFSRLEMAPAGDGRAGDDRLEVREVLELDVRSRLVFLSGCETALGPAAASTFDRGEDFATLSQAFLHAGAQNVIALIVIAAS